MSAPRVICLGNAGASDDGAALRIAGLVGAPVIRAGRPGAGLLDLLDGGEPVVLVDVIASGAEPGTIHRLPLADLPGAAIAAAPVSSHGFGPGEAIALALALGRSLPPGELIGVEGTRFEPGERLSPAVEAALPALAAAVSDAIDYWTT